MQNILQIILKGTIQLSYANSIWLIQGLFHYYGPLKYSIIIDQLLWASLIWAFNWLLCLWYQCQSNFDNYHIEIYVHENFNPKYGISLFIIPKYYNTYGNILNIPWYSNNVNVLSSINVKWFWFRSFIFTIFVLYICEALTNISTLSILPILGYWFYFGHCQHKFPHNPWQSKFLEKLPFRVSGKVTNFHDLHFQ